MLADPWWTIHFGGQANHVGTSHIPLCSNFNRHIFITPITSNHIILTYPKHSHQKYHNCRVQIIKMSPSSRMLLTYIPKKRLKKRTSPSKRFLYLCVLRFSGWAGMSGDERIHEIREREIRMEITSSKSLEVQMGHAGHLCCEEI